MKKKVILFYYQIIGKNNICNAVVPCLNQDSGEVQMGEVWNSLNSSVFQNSIVLQKMQNTANSKGEKNWVPPSMHGFHQQGQIFGTSESRE